MRAFVYGSRSQSRDRNPYFRYTEFCGGSEAIAYMRGHAKYSSDVCPWFELRSAVETAASYIDDKHTGCVCRGYQLVMNGTPKCYLRSLRHLDRPIKIGCCIVESLYR